MMKRVGTTGYIFILVILFVFASGDLSGVFAQDNGSNWKLRPEDQNEDNSGENDGVEEKVTMEEKPHPVDKQNDHRFIDFQDAQHTEAGDVDVLLHKKKDVRAVHIFSKLFEPPEGYKFSEMGKANPDVGKHVDIVWDPSNMKPFSGPDRPTRIQIEVGYWTKKDFLYSGVPPYPLKGEGNLERKGKSSGGNSGGGSKNTESANKELHWSAKVERPKCGCTIDVCFIIMKGAGAANGGPMSGCVEDTENKDADERKVAGYMLNEVGDILSGNGESIQQARVYDQWRRQMQKKICHGFNLKHVINVPFNASDFEGEITVDKYQQEFAKDKIKDNVSDKTMEKLNECYDNNCLTILLTEEDSLRTEKHEFEGALGYNDRDGKYIDVFLSKRNVKQGKADFCNSPGVQRTGSYVAAHEIGHAAGLEHKGSELPQLLMYPELNDKSITSTLIKPGKLKNFDLSKYCSKK